ncbi:3-hydroxybutyryl-CoA dehydrogenase [Streptomyces spinosirectus]|jgi:3-hydroxybutyryl-CoA dehydrogenase|uniref:3-hydroxybutyryl-CoA dehydrogenase n=1 Tax=Streptomyces TaxID=1883 RepID=UPI000D35E5BE|nr:MULTISPECIES: 3-hydroxybutyryl-CoA dehydrogenase [Streptomyces]MBY8339322.1 3-hydroxybutyryl-CoA dehydrogenase [Streptomyces plumbidurans]PTM93046.1 3-hydroxyacyl-CoA dehydrogenase [Streptomyces sp. VMFN-G11Ma]UIR16142.1 3-hydroxybutyryl-CoA dehydrogenase [Streptomyces spinosirectus]
MTDIEHVGVVGCGLMGAGIAEVCARAGVPVTVVERDARAAEAGRARIAHSLERATASGRLTDGQHATASALITVVDQVEALHDHDLVIEAVAEDEALKLDVFARLDAVVTGEHAILATNTSSIPVIRLAAATARPDHVVGVHFFNPVPVLRLVELVPSLLTSPTTAERAETFVTDTLGKEVVRTRDKAGFVVNALLVPYLLAAIRMVESGSATVEDVDRGMVLGCAHPLGPLALTDLIGLDTTRAIAESLYAEFREPQYSPPPLLSRMVEAGLLGRKSGRGFHTYADGPPGEQAAPVGRR